MLNQAQGAVALNPAIVRPWDGSDSGSADLSAADIASVVADDQRDSPLDALFNMASNFEALKSRSGMVG